MKNSSIDIDFLYLTKDYEEMYEDDCLDSGSLQYIKPTACYFSVNVFSECEDKLRVTITTKHAFTAHNAIIDYIHQNSFRIDFAEDLYLKFVSNSIWEGYTEHKDQIIMYLESSGFTYSKDVEKVVQSMMDIN